MATKKFLSLEKLKEYDAFIKQKISDLIGTKADVSHTHTISNISNLQAALDDKASSSHTHNYAGSSSSGGAATSANKLNTNAGSTTQPVYFSNGVPVATTHTINKSVPSNAVFTDTHYTSKNVVGATNATSNTSSSLTNGNVYINSVENGEVTSSHKISGSGATTVTTDTSGNIVISSTDNNTTYSAAGSSLGLVKSGGDVTISSGVITVNDDSHNHTIANVDNLQSSLDAKQPTITGGASTIASSNLTTNRALVSDSSGKVAVSAVTSTELGYLDGVTSNVQTQLDGKAASSHTHSATNITSGTLSSDRLPTVPISKGGTGATTAATALTNLGVTATASELNYVDGVTSNIQSQLNNKSDVSHTHNYAGSSSVGGSATSAEKLSSYINLSSSGSSNVGKFIKFGTITLTSAWSSCCGYLLFNARESASGCVGLLKVYVRLSSTISTQTVSIQWLSIKDSKYANAIKLVKTADGVFDLYIESVSTYEMNEIIGIFGSDSSKISLANSATWVDSIEADYQSSISSVASSCIGNAATATKLATSRTISLTGDVTGSATFNGSANASITATVADDSHNHTIANIDSLQSTLDSKLPITAGTLYLQNKALSWNTSSYLQHVILLLPTLVSTNWSGHNYIDGTFMCRKTGANMYDTVKINMNCVYNACYYHLEDYGQHSSQWKLCICTYNGISYYALLCPYHANPYTNVNFSGHIRSSLTGGTDTVALPLDVAYYNENTSTVLNEEVYESITETLTNTYVTSVKLYPLNSNGGFNGTSYTGSGVATLAEVQSYLGI